MLYLFLRRFALYNEKNPMSTESSVAHRIFYSLQTAKLRVLRNLNKRCKSFRIINGKICKNLTVQLDLSLL